MAWHRKIDCHGCHATTFFYAMTALPSPSNTSFLADFRRDAPRRIELDRKISARHDKMTQMQKEQEIDKKELKEVNDGRTDSALLCCSIIYYYFSMFLVGSSSAFQMEQKTRGKFRQDEIEARRLRREIGTSAEVAESKAEKRKAEMQKKVEENKGKKENIMS